MHHILASIKRVGLLSLAQQRKWLAPYAITPARYEMLFVIAHTDMWLKKEHFVRQSDIWRQLGVSPVTVSKMLKALERLGFVRRARSIARDRRQVYVELTRKARGLLRKVNKEVIRPGVVFVAICSMFLNIDNDVGMFTAYLDRIREQLNDPATFYYPWCDLTTHPNRRKRRLGPGFVLT